MTQPTDDEALAERPEATNRRCTVCGAVVAAWPQAMVCHCYEMPWPIDPALTAAQPVTTAECDLCVGECRGHSLGRPDEWQPEPGSRAAQPVEGEDELVERLEQDIADAESDSSRFAYVDVTTVRKVITTLKQGN